MLVNGVEYNWQPGITLEKLTREFDADYSLAVVDSVHIAREKWPEFILFENSRVVLGERGKLPKISEFITLLSACNPPNLTDKLLNARVGIAGCGGLGSNAAAALARMGIGELVLADFDIVEPTNLNRQNFTAEDIGLAKVTALSRYLQKINPVISIKPFEQRITDKNIPVIFDKCQIVLECFDQAQEKKMLVETLLSKLPEVKVVAASGVAGLRDANDVKTKKINSRLWLCGDGETGLEPGIGLTAPRVLIAAGHQALCAVRIINGDI